MRLPYPSSPGRWSLTTLVLLLATVALPSVAALYADVDIEVFADGKVRVDGTTNVPDLLGESHAYTSKQGERWLVNVTTPRLDVFAYRVRLPDGAEVNYVGGKNARLTTDGDRVLVSGSGEDAPLAIAVQYAIAATPSRLAWLPLAVTAVFLLALWFVVRGRVIRTRRSREATPVPTRESREGSGTPSYLEGLPERQREIVTLLRRADGRLTQRQVELALRLPKSSVSRNVEALRRRGVLEKAQLGMTNTLVLAERYR
jgi:hypothetical protein